MKKRWILVYLLVTIGLTHCNSIVGELLSTSDPTFREREGSNLSIVFGYLNMKDSPAGLGWLEFKEYASGIKAPKRKATFLKIHDGYLFWDDNVKPGSYYVYKFGDTHYSFEMDTRFDYTYRFKVEPNPTKIDIKKAGVYFVGSYKYNKIESGDDEANFKMAPITSVTEIMLLKKMMKQAKGTQWKELIKNRMSEIREFGSRMNTAEHE